MWATSCNLNGLQQPCFVSSNLQWKDGEEVSFQARYPLHRACRDGMHDMVQQYLSAAPGPEVLLQEDPFYGWTPAHWAAYFGKLECLKKLIEALGGPQVSTSRFSQTPAHIAAFGGHPQCLQWLLHAGANPNAQDYLGETPLHKAVRTGSLDCIAILANQGAKLDMCSSNQVTPSRLAANCGFREVSQLLDHHERQNNAAMQHHSNGVNVSNGYYGFHPVLSGNGVCSPAGPSNHQPPLPPPMPPFQPRNNGDVLLHRGVSVNVTPVAGRKRCREEVFGGGAKRICPEVPPPEMVSNLESLLATFHGC